MSAAEAVWEMSAKAASPFSLYRKILPLDFLYSENPPGDRTAAERNCVAKATRRRRRIPQAGFFVFRIRWFVNRARICFTEY